MVAEFTTDLTENRLWLDDQTTGVLCTPGNGRAARKLGRRAVVVGAGIGGLSAAGALAKYFEQVDILERDRLTASIGSRSGTPQDRHPHGLMAGSLRALERIFPGFESDLAASGAVPVARSAKTSSGGSGITSSLISMSRSGSRHSRISRHAAHSISRGCLPDPSA
jgi:2-polyprenyl-6-methoxyphenol hydroxylase-like FAD-dependent oxidoreductase